MDDTVYCDGKTCNVVYFDEQRGTVQNFFLVRTQGGDGACELRPMLVMKHAVNWNSCSEDENITLTNWCLDTNDKKHLQWEDEPKNRTLASKLMVSKKLQNLMSLPNHS